LLGIAYIAAGIVWFFFAEKFLYFCLPCLPVLSFRPPCLTENRPRDLSDLFLHYGITSSFMGSDYFYLPPVLVYVLWFGFVVAVPRDVS
jgi:hypothetical protein